MQILNSSGITENAQVCYTVGLVRYWRNPVTLTEKVPL